EGHRGRVERRLVAGLHRRDVVFDGRAPALDADRAPVSRVLAPAPLAVRDALALECVFANRGDRHLGREVQVHAAGWRARRAQTEEAAEARNAHRRQLAPLTCLPARLLDGTGALPRDFPGAVRRI